MHRYKNPNKCAFFFPFLLLFVWISKLKIHFLIFCVNFQVEMHFLHFVLHFCLFCISAFVAWILFIFFLYKFSSYFSKLDVSYLPSIFPNVLSFFTIFEKLLFLRFFLSFDFFLTFGFFKFWLFLTIFDI